MCSESHSDTNKLSLQWAKPKVFVPRLSSDRQNENEKKVPKKNSHQRRNDALRHRSEAASRFATMKSVFLSSAFSARRRQSAVGGRTEFGNLFSGPHYGTE